MPQAEAINTVFFVTDTAASKLERLFLAFLCLV